jgi:hypothetical protein
MLVRRVSHSISILLLVGIVALGGERSSAQPRPAPVPKVLVLVVDGPRAVPDSTRYEYTTNCPQQADWTVGTGGSPQTATGKKLEITWGSTAVATTIDVICGKLRKTVSVEVVQMTVQRTAVALGKQAADGGVDPQGLRLVDTSGLPPAVKFTAWLNVTGPKTSSPHWGGKITTGFVQRLVAAESAQWRGAYANDIRPQPDQSNLKADTTSDPPPKADCIRGAQICPSWYFTGKGFTYAPSASSADKISINDSPGPGWPNRNPHDKSQVLREAHAIWKFETYVCVNSSEAPALFFRRAVASWQLEATYNSSPPNNVVTGVVTPNLTAMQADVDADPRQCPVGGTGVNHWLNNIVTFN